MKRVGLILPSLPAYSETFFHLFIRSMAEEGMQVIVFTDQPVKTTTSYQVKSLPNSAKKWGILTSFLLILRNLIRSPIPTIRLIVLNALAGYTLREQLRSQMRCIHLLRHRCDYYHFGYGTMAIHREQIAKAQRSIGIISFRGFDFYIYPLKNPGIYNKILPSIDKVHVLSHHMKDRLIQEGFQNEITVIPPAIAIPNQHPIKEWKRQPLKILTVARLHWIKGFTYIIDALAILKQRGIPFTYTIVGDGPDRERILFAIHQAGLDQEVVLLGKVKHEHIWELYHAHSLYIQYSHEEGFCNALLEAQAAGLICIASDAGGHMENIIDGVTGFIVAKRSAMKLADQIQHALQMEPTFLQKMSIQAQQRVAEKFNANSQQQLFRQLYQL